MIIGYEASMPYKVHNDDVELRNKHVFRDPIKTISGMDPACLMRSHIVSYEASKSSEII